MRKIMYCTLDTETLGGASAPKGIYNIGGLIHNREGNIYASFNYIIAEYYREIDGAYYGKKTFPRYQEMINCGGATMVATESEAIQAINNLLNIYQVKYVMAYNTSFDFIKTAACALMENREFIDIYHMAFEIFSIRKSYRTFCADHNFFTKNHNCKLSVETMYAFLTNNPSFEEEHTAFSDASQEMEIFVRCVKAHKRYTKNVHHNDVIFGRKKK